MRTSNGGGGRIWLALAAALLLAGVGALLLERSLARPVDWLGRWSAESERTDDAALGFAALEGGAGFGPGKLGRGFELGPVGAISLAVWEARHGFTIEFWMQPREIKPERIFIGYIEDGKTAPLGWLLEQGEICLAYGGVGSKTQLIHSGVRAKALVWTHVAATSDGRDFRLFVDGKLAVTQPAPRELHPSVYAVKFGRGSPSPLSNGYFGDTENFQGALDEVGFYQRALDPGEVKQLWRATVWNPALRTLALQVLKAVCFGVAAGGLTLGLLNLSAGWSAVNGATYGVVWLVVLVGGALSAFACLRLRDELPALGKERLRERIDQFCGQFDTRTELYAQKLISLRDWLEARNELSPSLWFQGVNGSTLFSECPGVVEVGFALRVPPADRAAHEAAWSAYYTGYKIHPDVPARARAVTADKERDEDQPHLPVVVQLDKNSIGSRNPEFDRGWDLSSLGHGTPAGTEAWTLSYASHLRLPGATVGGAWGQPHFLRASGARVGRLYLSVTSAATNAAGAGSNPLRGLLFASIDWRAFFEHALEYRDASMSFRVFMQDGPETVPLADLGGATMDGASGADVLRQRRTVRFYRNRVTFDFAAKKSALLHEQLRWPWLIGGVGLAATFLTSGLLFVQVRARVKEGIVADRLRVSQEELQVALKDRERISRDLHDGTIQTVYAITLGLARCRKMMEKRPEVAAQQLEDSLGDLRNVITELREFLLTLEPELLKGERFPGVLESVVALMRRTTDTQFVLTQDAAISAELEAREAIHLLNIVREAVSNSVRHGGAREIRITVSNVQGALRLEVADDGAGFDFETVARGRGLENMAERAREMGASFAVVSSPGRGAQLIVVLPQARARLQSGNG